MFWYLGKGLWYPQRTLCRLYIKYCIQINILLNVHYNRNILHCSWKTHLQNLVIVSYIIHILCQGITLDFFWNFVSNFLDLFLYNTFIRCIPLQSEKFLLKAFHNETKWKCMNLPETDIRCNSYATQNSPVIGKHSNTWEGRPT